MSAQLLAFAAWLLHPLFSRIITDEDDETQRVRKYTVSAAAIASILTIPVHVAATIVQGEAGHELYYAWCAIVAATSATVLAHLLITRNASDRFVHAALLAWSTGILLADLHSMSALSSNRAVNVFILILDLAILASVQPGPYLILIALWLCVTEADLFMRYGLLDIPFTVSVDQRRAAMCNCSSPPCATSVSHFMRTSVIVFFVFILDFILTRRFARIAREEKEKVEAAVHTTSRIADCFARFDLDRASDILASAGELPDDLAHALGTILDNLTSYKPYLPSAFFMKSGADADIDASVPGWNGAGVAMVFTDIRQSTALWEHSAGAMKAALEVHNRIMRGGIAAHGGYEVKTIGDAFMAAFPSAGAAVRFGLGVQEALAGTVWPEGLGRAGAGARDEHDVLMVRIGVHVGEVSLEVNPATGRYDYFGSTVNKTARVEANGAAGAVTVTPEVMEAVWAAGVLEEVQVVPYADVRFAKGFAAGLRLTALVAGGAAGRYLNVVRGYTGRVAEDVTSPSWGPRGVNSVSSMSDIDSYVCSSVDRASVIGAMPIANISHSGMGTVCIVRLPSPAELPTLGACLAHGSLSTVVGNFAVVSWGAHRAMADHYKHAVGFVASLRTALAWGYSPQDARFHAGLASGLVTSGHVGATAAQRFVTICGACVDLGVMLCAGAAELGTCALVGSLERGVGVRCDVASGWLGDVYTRPVDDWAWERGRRTGVTDPTSVEWSVVVYEMRFSPPPGDGDVYATAWHCRDIDGLRASARGDAVAERVCEMLETATHLPHPYRWCIAQDAGRIQVQMEASGVRDAGEAMPILSFDGVPTEWHSLN